MSAYLDWLEERGRKERSIETTRGRLLGLHHPVLSMPLTQLTARRADQLYRRYAEQRKPDTHQNALKQARTFGKWCTKRGWLRTNPWELVEPLGRRSAGKRQLRFDDARALAATALSRAEHGDAGAVAVLLALCLGLRASEIVGLTDRDIDAGGRVLWVAESKTAAGRRQLEVPSPLHELLPRLPGPRLFNHTRWWVRDQVLRLCAEAQVPAITTHGLRGLHATLAVAHGVSAHAVAAALGHAGPGVTRRHYIAPGASSAFVTGEILRGSLSPAPDAPDSPQELPGTSDA